MVELDRRSGVHDLRVLPQKLRDDIFLIFNFLLSDLLSSDLFLFFHYSITIYTKLAKFVTRWEILINFNFSSDQYRF
jgi:hypothetical protein